MNIYRQYKPYGVVVAGVDIYNGAPALVQSRFVLPTGVTFPILTNGSDLGKLYGATTDDLFVIDPAGKVIYLSRYLNISTLQQALDSVTSAPGGSPGTVPDILELKQNYPNPFNPGTTMEYELRSRQAQSVQLVVYDMLGRRIRTLVDSEQPSGFYRIEWDGRDDTGNPVPGGAYLYRLITKDKTQTRKMVLMR